MRKFMIFSGAVTLATIWMVAPTGAQTTTTDKVENKMERAKDKAEDKAERAADKAESKTEKLKDKAVETKDKIKEKAVEAKDKIKEKTTEAKDKMKDKGEMAGRTDVRSAQEALRDKGFDPGPIDGIHGPRTTAAVRKFQDAEKLTVNGQLDDATMAKLNVSSPSASPGTAKRQNP